MYPSFLTRILYAQVRWVPCHHGKARPQVADGGDALQVWRVAANILNKLSQTVDNEWSSSFRVGRGANNEVLQMASDLMASTVQVSSAEFCMHFSSRHWEDEDVDGRIILKWI
jgi:hypothetical protein